MISIKSKANWLILILSVLTSAISLGFSQKWECGEHDITITKGDNSYRYKSYSIRTGKTFRLGNGSQHFNYEEDEFVFRNGSYVYKLTVIPGPLADLTVEWQGNLVRKVPCEYTR